jgi:hypothetical protein
MNRLIFLSINREGKMTEKSTLTFFSLEIIWFLSIFAQLALNLYS